MDILELEKVILRKIWNNETSKIALQKLIVNSLSDTEMTVMELQSVWDYISNVLREDFEKEEKKGNDETI